LVLTRYMELGKDREEFNASERPLRVLAVISRPQDERTVLSNDVVAAIEALNTEKEKVVSVEIVDQPTLGSIETALAQHEPHILHFIGHGRYDRAQKTGFLLLVNPRTNNSDPCDDSTLIECFRRAQWFPRLVFLHMCEGGISEKDATIQQAFSGFAPKLIHAKIPSVVAMQYPIKNPDARDFSLAFYRKLADGGSVDEAVQEGRSKLDLYRRSRLFGTPVLYMHSAGGLVLPKAPLDSAKSISSSRSESGAGETAAQPAASALSKPVPVDQAMLQKAVNAGFEATNSIQDNSAKNELRKRLFKMKSELMDKGSTGSTDIFNEFFKVWDQEADPCAKDVWAKVLQEI
jgi:hypothetical protein